MTHKQGSPQTSLIAAIVALVIGLGLFFGSIATDGAINSGNIVKVIASVWLVLIGLQGIGTRFRRD